MVQFSPEILDVWGGPHLSKLTECGAKELAAPNYHLAGLFNTMIMGLCASDKVLLHLDAMLLRRTNNAVCDYESGRKNLEKYISVLHSGSHRLDLYHSAVSQFEYCVSSTYQASLSYDEIENHLLKEGRNKPKLFRSGGRSDLERLLQIYNCSKHFNADKAQHVSSPVWLTDRGLECRDAAITFDELRENVLACVEICRVTFVEIPSEAYTRSIDPERKKQSTAKN